MLVMKTELKRILFCFLIFNSCTKPDPQKTPYDHIEDERVKEIISKAIAYAGGWDAWSTLHSIRYTKRSVLFNDSTLESDITQNHAYTMTPEFGARISWTENSNNHELHHTKYGTKRLLDGNKIEANQKKLTESVLSSLYVLGMPFKLLDEGAMLTYQGIILFKDSVEAYVINSTYDPDKNKNHSTKDVWWFYFEKKTGYFLGSKVFHSPTYALIQNLSFTKHLKVKLPVRRKSYRVDSLGTIDFLRAEFWYSNFKID